MDNNYVLKKIITYDCCFIYDSNFSLHGSADFEEIPMSHYGKSIPRYLHGILRVRVGHPTVVILQIKIDLDIAFRKFHVTP